MQRYGRCLRALLVVVIAAFIFGLGGFEGRLLRDNAIYVYSGQQMALGVPPYVSIFDHKGPLAPMLCGTAVVLGRWLQLDDVLACRIIFFLISILSVGSLFLLAEKLFSSTRVAFIASMTLVAFGGFGVFATSGPRAKSPMVLFEILALYLTASRRWFWAGLCGSLAALTWQPTVIYPVVTLFLALAQASSGKEAMRNAARALGGILLPVAVVTLWFFQKQALTELVEGWITFNLVHLDQEGATVFSNILRIGGALLTGFAFMLVPILLGLVAIPLFWARRLKGYSRSLRPWIAQDACASLLLTFPLPFFWSLLDFQDVPDLFVFLPYAALGFAWLLHRAFDTSAIARSGGRRAPTIFTWAVLVFLVGVSAIQYLYVRNNGLHEQRQWAATLNARLGKTDQLLSIGVPEALVLSGRTNPNPYVFILRGIGHRIAHRSPGGFDGWLHQLEKAAPSIVLVGETSDAFRPRIEDWLTSHYDRSDIGQWAVYHRSASRGSVGPRR